MSAVDEYLKKVDSPQKEELERIRRIVQEIIPDAKEVMSYGIPGFKYQKKYLLGYAAFKKHMSLFPTAQPLELLKDKLGDFELSKGTIKFDKHNPISEDIIKQLIKVRLNLINKKD